jgi:hypothetical protein
MLLQSLQQLPCLFQPALPDAQVGQPDNCRGASLGHALVEVPGGVALSALANHPFCTAQSPSTFPVIQAKMRATTLAAAKT